jgi:hypothetical protein
VVQVNGRGVGVFSGAVSIFYDLSQVIGTSEHRCLQSTTYQPKAPSRGGNGADPLSKEQ